MRRVVFVGNCQLQSLSQLYQRFALRAREEQITYLPSYETLTPERAATIAAADVIVEQRMDVAPRAESGGIDTKAARHFVPLLGGGFLWPFAGQPHPRNESMWFLPSGPFDGEMSDAYLNRLIEKGTPPDQAVADYLALDVNRVRNLDRFFEIVVDRQRSRDEACGFRIADLIIEHFRDEPLFRTPHHPNLRIALSFTTQFFELMEVDAASVQRLREEVRVTPYPKSQLPIHPAVARHFGLKYADERTRYRIRDEGRYTFAEYMHQYARGEWNRELLEGIALIHKDLPLAVSNMEAGLQRSPESPEGWYSYAEALRRLGRVSEAETAARRAIGLDPLEGRHFHGLGHALLELGRLDEAAEAAGRALALEPANPHFHSLAANVANRQGRLGDAETLLQRAVKLEPDNPHLHNMLGDLLLRQGRPAEAVPIVERAVAIQPQWGGFRHTLSRALDQVGRGQDALEAARQAVALDPKNPAYQGQLNALLMREGVAVDPEGQLREQIAADPDQAALYEQLGHLLAGLGRPEEAEAAFRQGVALAPNSAGPQAGLSHTLAKLGRRQEAIEAIEASIRLQPGFAPFHVHLGNQLWIVRDFDRAEAAYLHALALQPASADAAKQLRGVRAARDAARETAVQGAA